MRKANAPQGGRHRRSTARSVAFDLLMAVDERDAYANLELPRLLTRANLSSADARFATELAYGSLRMRGLYDPIIALSSQRKIADIDLRVKNILRLGVHQWIALGTAAHAMVDQGVRLAHEYASRGAVGFVNAVLRRVSEKGAAEWIDIVSECESVDESLAIRFSHPEWIIRAFRSALAHDNRSGDLERLLAADNEPALVALANLSPTSELGPSLPKERQTLVRPGEVSPRALILTHGDPSHIPEVQAGVLRVQDEGSQLAALILSRARPISSAEKWLDMCAGPGGKTAVLAAESVDQNVTLVANEISPHRAALVSQSTQQFSHVRVVTGNGVDFGLKSPDSFDRVLVDAPCSGIGALRRRPEARWRRRVEDVANLTRLQSELLDSALRTVSVGGLVAYVTCSPHVAETRAIVSAALRRHPNVDEVDVHAIADRITPVTPLDFSGSDRSIQLWPHVHDTDAMFIALLTRRQ